MTDPVVQHEYELTRWAGGRRVRAVIADVGAAIRMLSVGEIPLTPELDGEGPTPFYCGKVLVPWPNRVRDGRWTLEQRSLELAITDPEHHAALHGLLTETPYVPVAQTSSSITLSAPVRSRPSYPGDLDTEVRYELTVDGLLTTHSIRNVGSSCAPVAIGAHPFLAIGDVPTDTLTLTLDADQHIDVDAQLIPVGATAVGGTAWDLRGGRVVAELDLDDCWAVARTATATGGSIHTLRAADGRSVSLWADDNFGYVHVFVTRVFRTRHGARTAVAVEPMTAQANAFNSGAGLRWLAPGATFSASWAIRYDDGRS